MSTDAIIRFESLRCIHESDRSGGSEPYIWPALVWVDPQTLALPERIGFTAAVLGNAREVIKSGMRPGNVAPIPAGVGTLRVRLEDGGRRTFRRLLPIVALWENDDTPTKAMKAGFVAYVQALRSEMSALFIEVLRPGGPTIESLLPAALARVLKAASRAIGDGLSGSERFQLAIGTLNLDDFIAVTAHTWNAEADENFTLILRRDADPGNHYEIDVRASLKPVVIDPCQAQVNEVRNAEAAVEGVQEEIKSLQAELRKAPPLEKPGLQAEIRRLREEELPPLLEAEDDARGALEQCRARRNIAQFPNAGSGVLALR